MDKIIFFAILQIFIFIKISQQQVVNVAVGKPAEQTSTLDYSGFNWTADRAVDGCLQRDNPDSQGCCSASQVMAGQEANNSWSLNLTRSFEVEIMRIYARNDGTDNQLDGFELYITEQLNGAEENIAVPAPDNNIYTVTFPALRNVSEVIIRRSDVILVLCEVEVEAACFHNTYGVNCTMMCGNCLDGGQCDRTNGTCLMGCDPGWQGDMCVDECTDGMYGPNCQMQCGNCANSAVCDKADGSCPGGCMSGYQEPLCVEECINGMFGPNCQMQCGNCANSAVCDKADGSCPGGCMSGYQEPLCVEECTDGMYGPNCQMQCGNCANSAVCDKTNGSCPDGCMAGYQEPLCVEAVTSMSSSTDVTNGTVSTVTSVTNATVSGATGSTDSTVSMGTGTTGRTEETTQGFRSHSETVVGERNLLFGTLTLVFFYTKYIVL